MSGPFCAACGEPLAPWASCDNCKLNAVPAMSYDPDKPPPVAPVILAVYVLGDGNGWHVVEALTEPTDGHFFGYADEDRDYMICFTASAVIAKCADVAAGKRAVERAKTKERELRPVWQAAQEHLLRVTQFMQDATHRALLEGEPTL